MAGLAALYLFGLFKAEHLELGENTRFIVTNLTGQSQHLYDDGHPKNKKTLDRKNI